MWPFRKKKKTTKKEISTSQYAQIEHLQDDVEVVLPGCSIKMSRNAYPTLPHELTIILPRIEIRRRCKDQPECEEEIILNSITVVDAPRHPFEVPPEAKLPGPPPGPPEPTTPLQPAPTTPSPPEPTRYIEARPMAGQVRKKIIRGVQV